MQKIKELFIKYKDIISYGFFGACATLINMLVYVLAYDMLHIPNVPSTVIAWVAAFIFAFFSNKVWVFGSRSFEKDTVLKEFAGFFSARILTGLLDLGIMYAAVDVFHLNSTLWKLLSNVIVIILNYIASKFYIFKKKEQ